MAKKGAEGIKRNPVKPGKIELEAVSIASIINENKKDELVSNNKETVKSLEIMSPELHKGMSIPVELNTINNKELKRDEHDDRA